MDYSQLPEEIVDKIVKDHLETVPQTVAFAGVCKSWRSAARRPENRRRRRTFLPGLMISEKVEPYNCPTEYLCAPPHELIPLSSLLGGDKTGMRRKMNFHMPGQESDGFHCVASKDGWLVLIPPPLEGHRRSFGFISGKDLSCQNIQLVNPITGAFITIPLVLPPLLYPELNTVDRIILSSSPDDESCHIIIIFLDKPQLAWLNVAQASHGWKFSSLDMDRVCESWTGNPAYIGGKLYLVEHHLHTLHVVDNLETTPSLGQPAVTSFHFSSAMTSSYPRNGNDDDDDDNRCLNHLRTLCYITELDGQILLVFRHCYKESLKFQVFKLVLDYDIDSGSSSDYYWEEVKCLGGKAMFLAYNQSFCVPVTAVNSCGVKENCIYLALNSGRSDLQMDSDFLFWHRDHCGVFSLGDHKFERFPPLRDYDKCHYWHHYVWFIPMPWDVLQHKKFQSLALVLDDDVDDDDDGDGGGDDDGET